jgi:hypothetical protein
MAVREFSYKGKKVKVDQPDDQHAEVTIDRRKFRFMQHGDPLPMWMCDEAYFASPDLEESIRHIVDYWHIVTDDEHKAPLPTDLAKEHTGHAAPKKGGGKKSGHDHEGGN